VVARLTAELEPDSFMIPSKKLDKLVHFPIAPYDEKINIDVSKKKKL
jgi:hypothetical protein